MTMNCATQHTTSSHLECGRPLPDPEACPAVGGPTFASALKASRPAAIGAKGAW
jgi:hypothetical protein